MLVGDRPALPHPEIDAANGPEFATFGFLSVFCLVIFGVRFQQFGCFPPVRQVWVRMEPCEKCRELRDYLAALFVSPKAARWAEAGVVLDPEGWNVGKGREMRVGMPMQFFKNCFDGGRGKCEQGPVWSQPPNLLGDNSCGDGVDVVHPTSQFLCFFWARRPRLAAPATVNQQHGFLTR